MYTMEVRYLGKKYQFGPADSITLVEMLERQFGRILNRHYDEAGAYYETVRGAIAWSPS